MTVAGPINRKAESLPDDQTRVNWPLASGVTLVGVLVLGGAFPLRKTEEGYWTSLLVNLGTALLLFALLVWLEPKLYRRIREAVLARRTLTEAQQALREALSAKRARQAPGSLREDAVEQTVLWVGDRLIECGLLQVSASPFEMLFADQRAPDEPLITWKVSWGPEELCHKVTTFGKPEADWKQSLSKGNGPLSPVDQDALKAFQDQVSTILDKAASDLQGTMST